MIRKLSLTAALATAAFVSFASPASAQTYGGISLTFGSSGYGGYDFDNQSYAPGYYQDEDDVQFGSGYYDEEPEYAWQNEQRDEQIERWQQEQERRAYWEHERREHQNYDEDDD